MPSAATGFSYLVDSYAALEGVLVVLDPLTVAVEFGLTASHDADDEYLTEPGAARRSVRIPTGIIARRRVMDRQLMRPACSEQDLRVWTSIG